MAEEFVLGVSERAKPGVVDSAICCIYVLVGLKNMSAVLLGQLRLYPMEVVT
jgi:hypothetical protein